VKKILAIIVILTAFEIQAQYQPSEFRTVKGTIVDFRGEPMPGQSVYIKHTGLGTTTDWDGNFCIVVPKNQIIFIEISCCFTPIFRAVEPKDERIKIKIGRKSQERRNKRAYRKWEPIKDSLPIILKKYYSQIDYKEMTENICR